MLAIPDLFQIGTFITAAFPLLGLKISKSRLENFVINFFQRSGTGRFLHILPEGVFCLRQQVFHVTHQLCAGLPIMLQQRIAQGEAVIGENGLFHPKIELLCFQRFHFLLIFQPEGSLCRQCQR